MAVDLVSGYNAASDAVRNAHYSSSDKGNSSRDDREDRSANDEERREDQAEQDEADAREQAREAAREEKRRERERIALAKKKERERIEANLAQINAWLASAHSEFAVSASAGTLDGTDLAGANERLAAMNDAMANARNIVSPAAAVQLASQVRDSISDGDLPPFGPLWSFYQYNRPVAYGLVGDEDRCAIVMSMTLGLQPSADELSLHQIRTMPLFARVYHTAMQLRVDDRPLVQVRSATVTARYYVRAQQLADRLTRQFGAPVISKGNDIGGTISGKRGVIFLEDAYLGPRGWTGDHIDLWDGHQAATDQELPFNHAKSVWFWEIK